MSETDKADILLDELGNYSPEFEDGFSSRVMDKINELHESEKSKSEFGLFLRWISISGVAAVILLLIMIYFNEGTLNIDAIYGLLDYSPDEPLLASLNY
jgi:hypothetical protein